MLIQKLLRHHCYQLNQKKHISKTNRLNYNLLLNGGEMANRQHYVPKFIINRFKIKGKPLYYYNFETHEYKNKSDKVFSKFKGWDNDFENKLKHIEDTVSNLISQLANSNLLTEVALEIKSMTIDEKQALYTFMLIQSFINPNKTNDKMYFDNIKNLINNKVGRNLKLKFYYFKISKIAEVNKTFVLTDTPAVPEWEFSTFAESEPGILPHYLIVSPKELFFYGGEQHAIKLCEFAYNKTNNFNLLNIAVNKGKCEIIASNKVLLEALVEYYLSNHDQYNTRWNFIR